MKSILAIIIFLLVQSCNKERDKVFDSLCPDFMIYYFTRSGWTGWQYKVNIHYPDSLTIYVRHYIPMSLERKAEYLINNNEIDSLFRNLQILKDIGLKDYYGFGPNKPTDLPTTFIKYKLCNCTDSASLYFPNENEVPNALYDLMGLITRIVINHDTIFRKNILIKNLYNNQEILLKGLAITRTML